VVEAEGGVRHHHQDRRTQSSLSHCFLSFLLITVPVEARRNLSARGNNTQIRGAMCGRMGYKRESGKVGIDWHVKIIKQINDRAWQTRGHKTQQLGADFVNMRQAIYSTEQSNKMKYHLEPRKRERKLRRRCVCLLTRRSTATSALRCGRSVKGVLRGTRA
jgi:hypothetical protein